MRRLRPLEPERSMTIGTRLAAAGVASVAGALVAAVALVAVYGRDPAIRFEMDRDMPQTASGFYPSERDRSFTFAWTGAAAELRFPGLDRRVPWVCVAAIRGSRPEGAVLPMLRLAVDGVEVQSWQVRADAEELYVEVPARPGQAGLVLGITVSNTFRPGAHDPRDLGIMFDRLVCKPVGGRLVLPAGSAIGRAAAGAALLGAAFGLAGLPALVAAGIAAFAGLLQAWPLAAGIAPYLPGAVPVLSLAVSLGLSLVLGFALLAVRRREPAPAAVGVAAAVSIAACYLKLLILLHPSMPSMDAVFQAHRLDGMLDGHFYFTSLTPDGYHFPYGISLYLAAAPFAWLTHNHVALLRIVVVMAEGAAGLLIFTMLARAWSDVRTALLALVLFHVTPVAQGAIGTANLTNAFGESMAVASVAALVLLPLSAPGWVWLTLPVLLAAFAFVAHFSTLVVLAATVCAIGILYRWCGDPPVQRVSVRVLVGLGLAIVLSFAAFYGHFLDTYRSQAQRLTGEVETILKAGPTEGPGDAAGSMPRSGARRVRPSSGERFSTMLRRTRGAFGLALGFLALAGAVMIARRRRRDRLTLAIWAWLLTLLAFSALAVLTPLEMRYHLAVAPAVAMLAAAAAAGWMQTIGRRLVMGAAVTVVVVLGAQGWWNWLF